MSRAQEVGSEIRLIAAQDDPHCLNIPYCVPPWLVLPNHEQSTSPGNDQWLDLGEAIADCRRVVISQAGRRAPVDLDKRDVSFSYCDAEQLAGIDEGGI